MEEIKRSFYLGNYGACVSQCMEFDSGDQKEKRNSRIFEYLSRIQLKENENVEKDLKDTKDNVLKTLFWMNEYCKLLDSKENESLEKSKEEYTRQLSELMRDPILESDVYFLVVCSSFFCLMNDYKKALECVIKKSLNSLELHFTCFMILMKLGNSELAKLFLSRLKEKDDLAFVTQLSEVIYNMKEGGKTGIQDSRQTIEHFLTKYDDSPVLLNLLADSFMLDQNWTEAEKVLMKSIGKYRDNQETLMSLIICQTNLKKPLKLIQKYQSQLSGISPFNTLQDTLSKKFDSSSSMFKN